VASSITQLHSPIRVVVVAQTLPVGVATKNRNGACIAWWSDTNDVLWLVAFDETGECVWVPTREIRLARSWTDNRRY